MLQYLISFVEKQNRGNVINLQGAIFFLDLLFLCAILNVPGL